MRESERCAVNNRSHTYLSALLKATAHVRPRYANDTGFTQVLEERIFSAKDVRFFDAQIKRDAPTLLCKLPTLRHGNFLSYC